MFVLFSVLLAAGLLLACLTGYMLENYTAQLRVRGGAAEHWRGEQPPYPAGGMDNIFWFLQVSDIHISKFVDPHRAPDFQKFCTETIDVIKPEIVFVTGDLTDAKDRNRIGSRQYEVEWQTYQTILKKSRVLEKTKWIDIKGNHGSTQHLKGKVPSIMYIRLILEITPSSVSMPLQTLAPKGHSISLGC